MGFRRRATTPLFLLAVLSQADARSFTSAEIREHGYAWQALRKASSGFAVGAMNTYDIAAAGKRLDLSATALYERLRLTIQGAWDFQKYNQLVVPLWQIPHQVKPTRSQMKFRLDGVIIQLPYRISAESDRLVWDFEFWDRGTRRMAIVEYQQSYIVDKKWRPSSLTVMKLLRRRENASPREVGAPSNGGILPVEVPFGLEDVIKEPDDWRVTRGEELSVKNRKRTKVTYGDVNSILEVFLDKKEYACHVLTNGLCMAMPHEIRDSEVICTFMLPKGMDELQVIIIQYREAPDDTLEAHQVATYTLSRQMLH